MRERQRTVNAGAGLASTGRACSWAGHRHAARRRMPVGRSHHAPMSRHCAPHRSAPPRNAHHRYAPREDEASRRTLHRIRPARRARPRGKDRPWHTWLRAGQESTLGRGRRDERTPVSGRRAAKQTRVHRIDLGPVGCALARNPPRMGVGATSGPQSAVDAQRSRPGSTGSTLAQLAARWPEIHRECGSARRADHSRR